MVFKKIIFQNRYVALETPSRPPPFMANAILNFHFDYLNTSLTKGLCKLLEQGASGFMRNFGAFFETMMHLRGAFLAQRRTSYDLHLLRGAPIQNVTKF